ncbi:MAG: hypothetical protein A3D89_03730 [Planctomycetes bacterium RIFCSPHIGHO2_02_FULL_52_58]|nr:MAG: hypothetical protein A3D89_03730 [Planctomycetes bacterium RIFCSPHIGHO2_02_FULL_52_58]
MSPCGRAPTYSLGYACPGLTRTGQSLIHASLHRLETLGFKYGLHFNEFDVLVFPGTSGLAGIPRPFYNLALLPEGALQVEEKLLDCLLLHEYLHCLISWQTFHHPPSESPDFYARVREFLEDWKTWDRSAEFSLSHREDIKHCIGSIMKDKPWVTWGLRGIETRGIASHYVNRYFRMAREKLQEAELSYFQFLGKSVLHQRIDFSSREQVALFLAFLGFEYGEFLVEGLIRLRRTPPNPYDLEEGLCTFLATSLAGIPIKDFYRHSPHTETQESTAYHLQDRYGSTAGGFEDLLEKIKGGVPLEKV